MEKNKHPFSDDRGVFLAFASEFSIFSIIGRIFYGSLKPGKQWNRIEEVPGTLRVSVIPNDSSNTLYDVEASFRVAYSTVSNSLELERFTKTGIILRYTSGGGKERIAGTKENFLRMTISEPEGFDGYECHLKGKQKVPQCFV